MIVPLTLADFLERAELVYGDREAVVDEPNPPGGGLGRFTYAQFAAMARSLAAALDDLGVGENERVAIVSPNAARFLVSLFGVSVFGRVLVPVNFRLNAEEIRYIIEHSGSSVLLVDPELDEPLRDITVKHRFVLGSGDRRRSSSCARARRRALRGHRRERHRVDQLHLGHHRAAQGRAAHPPQLLAQRGHLRLAPGHDRPRRVSAHAAHVPLQRLGHALRGHRDGRRARSSSARSTARRSCAASRREGVTLFNCAPAVIAAVLDAAAARRGSGRGGAGARARAGGRRGRAAAVQDHRADRDRAGLGVHPDLRPHRDLAAADHQPGARGVGRARPGRARAAPVAARACPRSACA